MTNYKCCNRCSIYKAYISVHILPPAMHNSCAARRAVSHTAVAPQQQLTSQAPSATESTAVACPQNAAVALLAPVLCVQAPDPPKSIDCLTATASEFKLLLTSEVSVPMQLQHSLRDVCSCATAHRIAVVHVEFAEHTYFLAELAAHRPDLLSQGCAEHEDLLAVRCCHEDLLHIAAHVCRAAHHSPRESRADDVHAQHSLRDALVLHFTGVLKATVHNCAQQLWLQDEVAEATGMYADIVSLLGLCGLVQ
eukprot:16213-Heterococcus_DN1.PRE.3